MHRPAHGANRYHPGREMKWAGCGAWPMVRTNARERAAGRGERTVMTRTLALAAALLALPAAAQAAEAPAPAAHPFDEALASGLTRAEAEALARKALATCEALGEPAVAEVTDAGGAIRALLSSDGAHWAGLHSAPGKAAAVLAFHQSTHALFDRIARDKDFAARYKDDTRYFFHPGGLPLYRGAKMVGVLAVGGGHDKDEQCALAALASVDGLSSTPGS